MGTRKTREVPARLAGVSRRIERWRRTRKVRSRIPEPLWASAVEVADTYGIHRAAKVLRLSYYALKKRVIERGTTVHGLTGGSGSATFVELSSPPQAASGECIVEVENAEGAKMRMHLKGVAMPDLAALSRSFWNHQP